MNELFHWYITLARQRPLAATLIGGCVVFLVWACISSAYFEVDPAEHCEKRNLDRHRPEDEVFENFEQHRRR